jgi:hypothetical protein
MYFNERVSHGSVVVRGQLHNTNTLNGFKDLDKKKLFTDVANQVLQLFLVVNDFVQGLARHSIWRCSI